MVLLKSHYKGIHCPVCGNDVPSQNWAEHLSADFRLLRIIKMNHPKWTRQECEDHLRAISGIPGLLYRKPPLQPWTS